MLLVVFEGLDRTGKTTLADETAEALARRDDVDVVVERHYSAPTRHPLEEYEVDFDVYDPRERAAYVVDRLHWGERVWPTIYNRESVYTDGAFLHTELFLASRGALMVHATGTAEGIRARLDGPYPPPERIPEALTGFDLLCDDSPLRVRHHDFVEAPLAADDVVADTEAARAAVLPIWEVADGDWVGVPDPDVLFVGEEVSPKRRDSRPSPFRPWDGSSVYLMEALVPNADWYTYALTNARRPDGRLLNLAAFVEALGSPRVVALGAFAHRALRINGVDHGIVPHPQWVRRFAHSHLPEYPALLARATETQADLTVETNAWTS